MAMTDEAWVGPCVHGRDPWTRCDVCEERGEVRALTDRVHQPSAEAKALRGALRDLEWSRNVRGYDLGTCPRCLNDSMQGHEPDCSVRAALAQSDEPRR